MNHTGDTFMPANTIPGIKGGRFAEITALISEKSPMQAKRMAKYFAGRDDAFFEEAESFAKNYLGFLESQNISMQAAADAYLKLCSDLLDCQFNFAKTGKYQLESAQQALGEVYENDARMKEYMIGLAFSQFLWPTHQEIYQFCSSALRRLREEIRSYLEIGCGHGLFLSRALEVLQKGCRIEVVDISPASIAITRELIQFLHPSQPAPSFYLKDMLEMELTRRYDFIAMGEVLEHVNYPKKLLSKMRELLSDQGRGFVSTCVDCPTIDHVYHFKSIQEIRDMLTESGFRIEDERVLPVENLPMEEIARRRITINYCALLAR